MFKLKDNLCVFKAKVNFLNYILGVVWIAYLDFFIHFH